MKEPRKRSKPVDKKRLAVHNRDRGRQCEFLIRLAVAMALKIPPSEIVLNSKSARGCDMFVAYSYEGNFPFNVEVKFKQKLCIFSLMEQAESNAKGEHMPLALIKNPLIDNFGYAVLKMEDFFALMYMLNQSNAKWYEDYRTTVKELIQQRMNRLPSWDKARKDVQDWIIEEGDMSNAAT